MKFKVNPIVQREVQLPRCNCGVKALHYGAMVRARIVMECRSCWVAWVWGQP